MKNGIVKVDSVKIVIPSKYNCNALPVYNQLVKIKELNKRIKGNHREDKKALEIWVVHRRFLMDELLYHTDLVVDNFILLPATNTFIPKDEIIGASITGLDIEGNQILLDGLNANYAMGISKKQLDRELTRYTIYIHTINKRYIYRASYKAPVWL